MDKENQKGYFSFQVYTVPFEFEFMVLFVKCRPQLEPYICIGCVGNLTESFDKRKKRLNMFFIS